MSEIKVNKISQRSGTAITLGNSGTDFQLPSGAELVAQSGSTITIAAGATITNSGTSTGFGATGAVNWDTTPKTTTVTAVSGVGYFVNTTSGAITVNLPAGVAGSIVAVSDYANTAATNNIIIDPNGTDKINGVNADARITTNGASITLIYVDATRGWKDVNDATLDTTGIPPFVAATGGCIATCGNYKIHTFTGPGTFTVTNAGTPTGSNSVDYLVVAGGGGGGRGSGAGAAGAGGFRESVPSPAAWTASPLANPGGALPVSVQGYPITVGAGGVATSSSPVRSGSGTPSVFSTITSTGGGAGGNESANSPGESGGSGGGGAFPGSAPGGTGNTPPTSPSQGNNGGSGVGEYGGGGGGGATTVGSNATQPGNGGPGGNGAGTGINPSPTVGTPGPSPSLRYYAGGGGGGSQPPGSTVGTGGTGGGGNGGYFPQGGFDGTVNTGGGGGGDGNNPSNGGDGGSGIVIIRYKFQ
jgi:hypothetical protein